MKLTNLFLLILSLFSAQWCFAGVYDLPTGGDNVVGQLYYTHPKWHDNFHAIGRRNDEGYDAIVLANRQYNPNSLRWYNKILVPGEYILPPGPHEGIVINLPAKRIFFYSSDQSKVFTFPIGIGKEGWATPQGALHVVQKIKNPTWTPPKNILAELRAQGYNVPDVVAAGAQNPLGAFAMRLSNHFYLIHGTNDPNSIGTRASSGCIRLFPEDIATLFVAVPLSTPVRIVDAPYQLGWRHGALYLSAYPPLSEDSKVINANLTPLVTQINNALLYNPVKVNWQKAIAVADEHNGVPQQISI